MLVAYLATAAAAGTALGVGIGSVLHRRSCRDCPAVLPACAEGRPCGYHIDELDSYGGTE